MVCSPSEGGVVSVLGELLRADTPAFWDPRGGLVLGSVCWLVGVSCEVRAVPLVAAHSRRQSMAALLCLTLCTQRTVEPLKGHWTANIQNAEIQTLLGAVCYVTKRRVSP